MDFEGPDYYRECHDDPINATPFSIVGSGSSLLVETMAGGNVIVTGLSPDIYAVRSGLPADLVHNAIFCAPSARPGTPFAFAQTGSAEITLELVAGDDVICDWYIVPDNVGTDAAPVPAWTPPVVDQTLTISGTLCPVGYEGNNYSADCSYTTVMGALFAIHVPGTKTRLPRTGAAAADDNGVVTFALDSFVPGPIRLHAILSGDMRTSSEYVVPFVSCASASNDKLEVTHIDSRASGQIVELTIEAGDDVRCDVYFLPRTPSP